MDLAICERLRKSQAANWHEWYNLQQQSNLQLKHYSSTLVQYVRVQAEDHDDAHSSPNYIAPESTETKYDLNCGWDDESALSSSHGPQEFLHDSDERLVNFTRISHSGHGNIN